MFWLSYERFSILCNAFSLKSAISSHNSCGLSQLYVQGLQFEQDYLRNVTRLCPYNTGSSQLWNARSRFAIHAGHLPLTLPLTFQHSSTTDR